MMMLLCLPLFCLASLCDAIAFTQITHPAPAGEKRLAKDAWISGDGKYVIFMSDADHHGTATAEDGDNVYNIWRYEVGTAGAAGLTKVSHPGKPIDKDAEHPVLSHDGSKACYTTDEGGTDNIQLSYYDSSSAEWQWFDVTNATHKDDKSRYCSISPDGSAIAFMSLAELVQGMPTIASGAYQIYLTRDAGQTFTLVTPSSVANESHSDSDYPSLSLDGKYVVFRSKMIWPAGAKVSTEEAWMYRADSAEDEALAKITNLSGKECSAEEMYDLYVSLHGESALASAGVTKGFRSSCDWAALHGHRTGGAATISVGAFNPEVSGDGRFVVYTTNFDVANGFGTHEVKSPVAHHNLFLYDRVLGLTWQITNTGSLGAGFKNGGAAPMTVEEWCCPSAPSSKQRGSCSTADELRGWCCWQAPCGFPALNPHISGDGHHIVFVSDFDFLGTGDAHLKDLEIWNYHIPTSSLVRVTTTSNDKIDDVNPRNSHDGSRIVWHGKGNYTNAPSDDNNFEQLQVVMASLQQGCSWRPAAANYIAAPDVEICCVWPSVAVAHQLHQLSKVEVTLTFTGNIQDMWGRLPWPSTSAQNGFCEQFVMDVHHDLSCALGVPLDLIQVVSPKTAYAGTKSRYSSNSCGDWATASSMGVVVDFLPMAPTESLEVLSPQAAATELITQHGDANSRLWKGYITKTLRDDTPTSRVIDMQEVPNVPQQCTSAGSCYSMDTHRVTCNTAEADCQGSKKFYYAPGFIGGSGCCHCQASCDFSEQTNIYESCRYYDEGEFEYCDPTTSTVDASTTMMVDANSAWQLGSMLATAVGLLSLFCVL